MRRGSFRCCIALAAVLTVAATAFSAAPASYRVDAERLRAMVSEHIDTNMPWAPGCARFEITGRLDDVVLPSEKFSYSIQGRDDDRFLGDSTYMVKFSVNGLPVRQKHVTARIEVLMDIVVAKRALGRNEVLSAEDVAVAKKWMRGTPYQVFTDPADVVGKKLCADLWQNMEIRRSMVRDVPVVKKGKLVRIVLENRFMNVHTIGLTEEDGMNGQMIRVQNVSSKKVVYARVESASVVRVGF
ncbi:MAG: flagellar basal body P-ring biosynthesis protein FlgA [Syntrophaceae bacterium PtaU1.Bin231]|nr:MAG: flagellar basal body P-ring biosynthesis protein FlgA [Syntrophaceae bacterium PtaU1.Bin231]